VPSPVTAIVSISSPRARNTFTACNNWQTVQIDGDRAGQFRQRTDDVGGRDCQSAISATPLPWVPTNQALDPSLRLTTLSVYPVHRVRRVPPLQAPP
jgi:hypothetical protein